MGEVWLARDTSLGREVAVKLLHHSLSDDDRFRARFQAEARHAASLHDSHIATVFDYGDELDEQGSHRSYLVMEYVDGQPLSALLRGPVPQEQAANLVAQAAEGLAVAHAAGIVHRDVKPANFLVTPDRRVKITDFGVARARGSSSLTETGTIIGTPSYVAPEVAEGREATAASDLYSLGVVLYECLAGNRPFTGDTPVAVAISHLRDEPPPLPAHVSPPLRALAMQALAKDPAARPASAAAFAAALRSAAAGDTDAPTMVAPGPSAAAAPGPATSVLPAAAPGAAVGPASGTSAPSRRERSRGMAWPLIAVAAAIVLIVAAAVAISALSDDPEGAADTPGPGSAGETTQRPRDQTPTQGIDTTSSEPASSEPETTASESSPSTETSPTETVFVDPEQYVGRPAKDVEAELKELGLRPKKENLGGDGPDEFVVDLEPTGDVPVGSEVILYVEKTGGGNEGQEPGQGEGHGEDDDDD
jgi:serine/threonine-protein kinase